MEGSLILSHWPISPFATALAAGALFAFCVALLKRQNPPKRRHSAPARLGDHPQESLGGGPLYRTSSEGFLNRLETGAIRRLPSSPSISNFPAFDGRIPINSPFHLSRFPFSERPFSFSDDLINIEKQFHKLYDFPSGRRSRRRGHSSLPNFGITSRDAPFPGYIPLSKHLSPFRSLPRSGSLTRRWKSVTFEPELSGAVSSRKSSRKFTFYSDPVLLPGTLSFRKKCYSSAFEFSRFRATFCASIRTSRSAVMGRDTEPKCNMLSVPNISVRKSISIPTELSRLDEVCDINGIENGNLINRNGSDHLNGTSSSETVDSSSFEGEGEYTASLIYTDSFPSYRSINSNAEKQSDFVELGNESSYSQTEIAESDESSLICSSELESVILRDEAYETVESESKSLEIPLDETCGSSSEENGAISKVDSASRTNKRSVNASGLHRRKKDEPRLGKIEYSNDELVKARNTTGADPYRKLFSLSRDSSAEYCKEEDFNEEVSEYESLKSDIEALTIEDSATDSFYSILERSENLLKRDSTEEEVDSSADFLTPENAKVLSESFIIESLPQEEDKNQNVICVNEKKECCDNEKDNLVLSTGKEISDDFEASVRNSNRSEEIKTKDETLVMNEGSIIEGANNVSNLVLTNIVEKKVVFDSSSPSRGIIRCLNKDEKLKVQEFCIYEDGNTVLYEAVENNIAVEFSSDEFGKGARPKTPKTDKKAAQTLKVCSISENPNRGNFRSFSNTSSEKSASPVVCQGVVSIGPGFVDLSVSARPIEGHLARFQGGDNAKRAPIERRDVTRAGESSGPLRERNRQMERGYAPERTRVTSDVRVGDDLRVVSSLWSSDKAVVSDVWTEERGAAGDLKVVIQDVWRSGMTKPNGVSPGAKEKVDWRDDDSFDVLTADFHPVATPERADEFRPTFEEFMPEEGGGGLNAAIRELETLSGADSPRRVNRLLGLLKRDDERRKAARVPDDPDGEWDRILGDLLRSVSELEAARRRLDSSAAAAPPAAGPAPAAPHSAAMDGAEESCSPSKGETPTKVKNLRFKLDPDVFDVPSDDSFYEEEWKHSNEPVRLVSVHASVVPAGQKSVARPVGIDLRVRLTDSSKRSHGGTPPAQAKRRSPVVDPRALGWCQELSPVTENVDWRETFTPVSPKEVTTPKTPEPKPVPNGILKTPSPKVESVARDTVNPFKGEMTNGHSKPPLPLEKPALPPKPTVTNGFHAPRKLSLPRKKFEPDPEAIERITGYKVALAKPPLPHVFPPSKPAPPPLTRLNRAEIARKQYLDSRAQLSAPKADKFQQFLRQAQSDRARIGTSVPDLVAIEKAVSEKWAKERALREASPAKDEEQRGAASSSSRGSTPDDAWASYVQSFRKSVGRRSQSLSYLETDVDLLVTDEEEDKWRSTSALDSGEEHPQEDSDLGEELADDSGRARSEHELRIQRSLQSLPLPDWYKKSDKQKTGFILKSSSEKEKKGWAAAKSLASSTSSLASCGLSRRPVRSLRSSRENIPWSRGSPDGPALSLALAKAFREPYLGWRARTSTTSSGVSSRTSPCGATTDEGGATTPDRVTPAEASTMATTDVSFDGEDAFGRTSSSSIGQPDDTGADAVTVSMDTTGEDAAGKTPCAEDTCEDINNMSMDTFEEEEATGDNLSTLDNLSSDTDTSKKANSKRFSYSQSIYYSEWDEESRGDRKGKEEAVPEEQEDREESPSSDHKVIWIESSFVGSRTTTSIVVLPENGQEGNQLERPASR